MKNFWMDRKKTKACNARFLNEAKQLESRWAKSGLLNGMNDRFDRKSSAVLLESMRLPYEVNGSYEEYDEYVRQWNERMK